MAIYFDNNASTHIDQRVFEVMKPCLTGPYGNASSLHRFGRDARDAIDAARQQVADLVAVQPTQVVFTSGGTESNNMAIQGVARNKPGSRILISAIEHPSAKETGEVLGSQGWDHQVIRAGQDGLVDVDHLESLLSEGKPSLVSVMRANNETGAIQPVEQIAERAARAGAVFHCDAVQAAGKMPLDFAATGAQLMSLSSHKIHGPKGVGALIMKRGLPLMPLLHGGGHEQMLRGGTENLASIVGFGQAAELARLELDQRSTHVQQLRDRLQAGVLDLPGITVFAADMPRITNTLQFSVPGYDGEALLMDLDRAGIAVSSGSACASSKGEPSHVLLAMGIPADVARGAIRVSLCKDNTQAEVDQFLSVLSSIMQGASARMASVLGASVKPAG